MNELQQNETVAETNQVTSLPEPHFDELAIAVAQPVEPLPDPGRARWQKLAVLSRHISATALLFILFGAAGVATLAFGLAGLHRWNAVEPEAAAPIEQSSPAETGNVSAAATPSQEAKHSRQSKVKKIRLPIEKDGKPVARKVGEIVN